MRQRWFLVGDGVCVSALPFRFMLVIFRRSVVVVVVVFVVCVFNKLATWFDDDVARTLRSSHRARCSSSSSSNSNSNSSVFWRGNISAPFCDVKSTTLRTENEDLRDAVSFFFFFGIFHVCLLLPRLRLSSRCTNRIPMRSTIIFIYQVRIPCATRSMYSCFFLFFPLFFSIFLVQIVQLVWYFYIS